MNLASKLAEIRADLKAAQDEMMSKTSESTLGDMFIQELGAIWRSIDTLAAAIAVDDRGSSSLPKDERA